jgi:parallel beta-helix repeat protein
MKGEFSRFSFNPRQHYAGVLQQQGRVGLDSDWNEFVEMVLHRLSLQTIDTIGRCGRPEHAPGFVISVDNNNPPGLLISDGRLYAGGLLAQSESKDHAGTEFAAQFDWPIPAADKWNQLFPGGAPWPGLDFSTIANTPNATLYQLAYAEVWLRHVTALEEEAERDEARTDAGGNPDWTTLPEVGDLMRERALGGPDTCTRLQTVAQVKLWSYNDPNVQTCDQACAALAAARPPGTSGTMLLAVPNTPPVTKPCQEPLQGGYGGAFNATSRVEIHDDGADGKATFKWSNENGAFEVRINGTEMTAVHANSDFIITSIGKDQETQLSANDWVEVCGQETELGVFRNPLAQVRQDPTPNPDGTWTIQLNGDVVLPHAPFLRRWSANTQTIELNHTFNLDAASGLSIKFFDQSGGTANQTYFHAQDYWVWSARTDTRSVEPEMLSHVAQPPRGIPRHYCCLALLTWKNQNGQIISTANTPCTPDFPPLTELTPGECCCCCAITVGDGVISKGQYNTLEEAFAKLPDTSRQGGIVVCILEGVHTVEAPIAITQDRVVIRGCGLNTFIEAPMGAFNLVNRRQIAFSDIVLESRAAPAILAVGCSELSIGNCRVHMSLSGQAAAEKQNAALAQAFKAPKSSIVAEFAQSPALLLQGWLLTIAGNEIRGAARGGGIGIAAGSGQVLIERNNVHKSTLPGVDLSYVYADKSGRPLPVRLNAAGASLDEIEILHNRFQDINAPAILQASTPKILRTTLSAPAAAAAPAAGQVQEHLPELPGLLADLTIRNNLITHCGIGGTIELWGQAEGTQKEKALQQEKQQVSSNAPAAAVQLTYVMRFEASHNRIVKNGAHNSIYAGILVDLSEGVIIRNNVISENGRANRKFNIASGGVLIGIALPEMDRQLRESAVDAEGWRSLLIEDNVIESQNGSGIRATGIGSMRVAGNIIQSRSTGSGSKTSTLADAGIVLLNFGFSAELSAATALQSILNHLGPSGVSTIATILTEFGGLVQVTNNQVITSTVEGSDAGAILAFCGDDLTVADNQFRLTAVVSAQIDALLFAYTVRILGNRFIEPLAVEAASLVAVANLLVATGNEATHCLLCAGTDAPAQVGLNLVNPMWQQVCAEVSKRFIEEIAQ